MYEGSAQYILFIALYEIKYYHFKYSHQTLMLLRGFLLERGLHRKGKFWGESW